MTDEYAFWRNTLAGAKLPFHDSDPQPGFYRLRKFKGGPLLPVAIWRDGDKMLAMVGGDDADATEIWSWCCDKPISHETYKAVLEGAPWPDMDDAAAASLLKPDIGHNLPGDNLEVIRDQIEAALAGLDVYTVIREDEAMPRAQSLRSRLNELANEADKQRTAEKAPFLQGGKDVDTKWRPLIDRAREGSLILGRAMSIRETENAAVARAKEPPEPNAALVTPRPAPAMIKGAYGRGVTPKKVRTAKSITDKVVLWTWLDPHPELSDLMLKLAQRALDKGFDVPGVEIVEEIKV